MKDLPDRFLETLRSEFPGKDFRPLHEPEFVGNEWIYVKECLDTGWVSSAGKYVDRFECELAAFCGARYAVATVNGTSALHIALLLAGVEPSDEVIVPALSFVATANAVSYCQAIPHFVDSEEATLGLAPDLLDTHLENCADRLNGVLVNRQTGRKISAVVPMHTLGHPVHMPKLLKIAEKYQLNIVEDAAESLGSYIGEKHVGTFGMMGVLSFNGNKIITTGGGGAIITDDYDLAKKAKHLTTVSKLPHRWEFFHDCVGYNYRLPNLNAALGVAQLERISGFLSRKRELAERYKRLCSRIDGVSFVDEPLGAKSNFWLNACKLDSPNRDLLQRMLVATNDNGFMTRPCWALMHKLPMYQNCPRSKLVVAEDIENRLINLPSSPNLI